MCRCLTLFCSVLLTLGFAPAPVFKPKPDQKGTDLQRLQGIWIGPKGLEARFEKDRLTYFRDGKLVTVYQVIVNASTEPKSIDLVGVAGGADDGRTYLIIYRLGVNTLTTCSNGWTEPRPAGFRGPMSGRFVESYTRKER